MKQLFALALCAILAPALTGCDFVGSTYTVPLSVSSVRVDGLPLTDRGEAWDSDSNPDIVLEIQNAAGRSLYRSEPMTDVDLAAGPITYDIPEVTIPSLTTPLYVVMFETDGDRLTDQSLRTSVPFRATELEGVEMIGLGDIQGRSFSAEVWTSAQSAE